MQQVNGELNDFQRALGMTVASMPFWLIFAIYGLFTHRVPSQSQVTQTFVVAIFSGIIATVLFFYAIELVQHDNYKLAGVEATSAGEVIFALLGEIIFLEALFPNLITLFGIVSLFSVLFYIETSLF